jgi:hypothetical protein
MAWGARAAVTKPQLGQMLSIQGQMSLNLIGDGMRCSSTMHHTVILKAALIPRGAYLSQMTTQWTWSVVIATMTVQPLERAVPQSAGIVHPRAGARRVVLDVAAASRQRAVPQMMIATMTVHSVQPLECRRAVPQSVGIVYPRAGARRVVVDAAAASRQPLGLVRRVDLAGSRVRWRLRMTPQTTVCWNRLRVLQPR